MVKEIAKKVTPISEWNPNQKPFVTVYKPIAGWKAVMYWWNNEPQEDFDGYSIPGGFWEPWQTGSIAYATREEAIEDAKSWAIAEECLLDPDIAFVNGE